MLTTMKAGVSHNAVIFGHYDSRGGTTAVLTDDLSVESIALAMKAYAKDGFGDEDYAFEAAKQDLIGLAVLVAPPRLVKAGADLDEHPLAVLAVGTEEPERDYLVEADESFDQVSAEVLIDRLRKRPLWFLVVTETTEAERDALLEEEMPKSILRRAGLRYATHPSWNDDAYGFLVMDIRRTPETTPIEAK